MDLLKKIDSAYGVPSQIAILNGFDPIDIRYVCDSVKDFQDAVDNYSFEMRYEGLVTFEKTTGKLKLCKGNASSGFTWTEVGAGGASGGSVPNVFTGTITTSDWQADGGDFKATISKTAHGFELVPENLVILTTNNGVELMTKVTVDSSVNVIIKVSTTDGLVPDESVTVKIYGWK